MMTRVPAIVLGGTGYVAGELLRLLAAHRSRVRTCLSAGLMPCLAILTAATQARLGQHAAHLEPDQIGR